MSDLIRRLAPVALLVLTALAAFAVHLGGEFIWDDTVLVVENKLTGDWRNLPRFFTVSLWETSPLEHASRSFYRPLMLVELALDRTLIDPPAAWLHRAHNLVWHLAGVVLLHRFLQRLRPGAWLAFPAAALYALHPLQSEVVAFTAARNDAMASALMLGALLALLPAQCSWRRLLAGALLFAGALLSKEVAVATPLILLGLDRLRHGRPVGPPRHGALWAVVLAWAALRLALDFTTLASLPPDLWTWARHTTQILAAPWTTSPTAYLDAVTPLSWALPLTGVALLAVGLAGGAQARLGLTWALITLLPCIPAVAGTEQMPYRYLTLPLAGLAVALHGAWRPDWSRVPGVVGALCLAAATVSQAPQWHDSAALWKHGWELGPSSRSACGMFKVVEDRPDAHEWLDRALAVPPAQYCCFSATRYYWDRGDASTAVSSGHRALDAGCDASPELLAPLSVSEAITGDWEAAEQHATRALPDPTGLAPVVLSAAAQRRGDDSVLESWSTRSPTGASAPLEQQVQWLLDQAGP